jgi:hypothetical protein
MFWRKDEPAAVDTTGEARACLEQLEQRDRKVDELAHKLREAQRLNQFSAMVNQALARPRPES